MDGNLVGLVAVIMIFGIPIAAMYTLYHVRKLRTEERLAAIARGANVPMQPELPEAARSRRSGILLVTGALGYMLTFALIARVESDAGSPRPSASSRSASALVSFLIPRSSVGTCTREVFVGTRSGSLTWPVAEVETICRRLWYA